jgi:hypothetical protein
MGDGQWFIHRVPSPCASVRDLAFRKLSAIR